VISLVLQTCSVISLGVLQTCSVVARHILQAVA
jgi:hypothetical protein